MKSQCSHEYQLGICFIIIYIFKKFVMKERVLASCLATKKLELAIKCSLVGCVLWHINHCKLVNRTCLYSLGIYIRGAFNKFPDVFVQAFKIVVDS